MQLISKTPLLYLASKGVPPNGFFPRARVRAIKYTDCMNPTKPVTPFKAKPAK